MAELTSTSYVVLGFLARTDGGSPYDLTRMVAESVGYFWRFPRSQLYAEPARLAGAGYLVEQQEEGGRRRRSYALTDRGREALADWLETPTDKLPEMRDPALLRLFFGADQHALATTQRAAHELALADYERLRDRIAALRDHLGGSGPAGPLMTLEACIAHEHVWIAFWAELAGATSPG